MAKTRKTPKRPRSTRDWTLPPFRPQPRQAALLSSPADIAIFGGSIGGGKSFGLCMEVARWMATPGFTSVMFRKTYPEITMAGGLWQRLSEIMRHFPAAEANESDLTWTSSSGARVKCSHLQHRKNRHDHQGAEYTLICFDELAGGQDSPGFDEDEFWFLMTRNRNPGCAVRPYVRASCNPNPDHWTREFIDWWIGPDGYAIPERSGVIRWFVRDPDGNGFIWGATPEHVQARVPDSVPMSATFILSTLADNAALVERDPTYGQRVAASLHWVERLRLLGDGDRGGNWDIRPERGSYFRRDWFPMLTKLPKAAKGLWSRVRAWDLAATPEEENPKADWTVGVKMARARGGLYVVEDVVRDRIGPGGIERLLIQTAISDGPGTTVALWQDPGQAGKHQAQRLKDLIEAEGIPVEVVVAAKDKETYARPVSVAAEPKPDEVHGDISLLAGEWNSAYLGALVAFPESGKDDVDATSLAWIILPHRDKSSRGLSVTQAAGRERRKERDEGRKRAKSREQMLRGRWADS